MTPPSKILVAAAMAVRPRYLEAQVRQDLRRKMVFVAGPRQVGKTTLPAGSWGERPATSTGTPPRNPALELLRTLP